MTLADYIPFTGTGDAGAEAPNLAELFRERESTLDLTAVFGSPQGNTRDEPTAVFPYTLLDSNGDVYGEGAKEFVIPDDGFKDNDAAVTQFVGGVTETPAGDVGVGNLSEVEGTELNASFNDYGDVVTETPDAPAKEVGE